MRILSIFFVLGLTLFFAPISAIPNSESWEFKTTTEILWETVASISSQIEKAISLNKDSVLDLYNRRGIAYLFLEEYDKALDDFTLILQASDNVAFNQSERCLMGAGLWGTFFCHACQNLEELALEDFRLIEIYFLRDQPCAPLSRGTLDKNSFEFKTVASLPSDYFSVHLTANFADSNEIISSSQCKDRVIGTANVMRLLLAKIRTPSLIAAAEFAIAELERACCACCDRSHWTECLSPIVDGWNYMKECMNKGAAIAPYLIWPGR